MLSNKLRHFKHGDLSFFPENGFELFVAVDHALVAGILKLVLLDVNPKLLGDFSPGNRLRSNDLRKSLARLNRSHELRVACRFLRHLPYSSVGVENLPPETSPE